MKPHAIRPGAWLATQAAVILLLAVTVQEARPQSGRLWRAEERVLVTSFQELGAVATDSRRVYAASPEGIEVYDFASGRWEAPITMEDGYPTGERPTALAHDAFGDALWLGTAAGNLYAYRIGFGRWELIGPTGGGPVLQIVASRDAVESAIYLAVPGGWLRLGRGSLFPEPVGPEQVPAEVRAERGSGSERLGRMDPFFDALRGTLTLDERLRRWPIADVAPAEGPARFWVATQGGNLLFYDSRRMNVERYSFGLLSRGAGALALDGARLWFGGDGRGARRGVSQADATLQRWREYEAQYDGAPAGYVAQVLPTAAAVWFAASDGLFRHGRQGSGGPGRWLRLTDADGLPSTEALALAPAAGGVWVGTRAGLTFVSDDGVVERSRLFAARRVNRLAFSGDTLWAATEFGLWFFPGGDAVERGAASGAQAAARLAATGPLPAPGAAAAPLRGRILDVRAALAFVYALTEDALWRYDGQGWSGPDREAAARGLGRLSRLAVADGQLWVAGAGGVARWDAEQRLWSTYLVSADIPEGPVRDILPAGEYVWAATPAGALRLEWRR